MLDGSNQLKPHQITLLLNKASTGDDDAIDELIPMVYSDLKLIASGLRHKQYDASNTLNTTALVNEAWLKLKKYGVKATSQKHFFCIIAKAMRQILINTAKQRLSKKRDAKVLTFADNNMATESDAKWLLEVEKIIQSLEGSNKRLADVFQLKYFLGLTESETAKTLEITDRTVRRDWITVKKIIKELI
jgi:RNA polymerase sigma factor (TIGR02999 family)